MIPLKKYIGTLESGEVVESACHPDLAKALLWETPDGRTAVTPIDPFLRLPEETEEQQIERTVAKLPMKPVSLQVVDFWAGVPLDRTFRRAWRCGKGSIEHDMEKCRAIHRDRLRAMRKPKLEALDIEYQRADERADAVAKVEIAKKKQVLRDAPADPAIDAATTIEELKAVLPECLK